MAIAAAQHASGSSIGYRPWLDVVRALAIGIVLAGHADIPGMASSGAVGVAIFFVLSGYLITTLLLIEHGKHGTINLRGFYWRRGLRLLPAVFTMLLVVIVLSILHNRLGSGLRSAAFVAGYVGNWVLALGGSLFRTSHTWSLAIEEQFYLIWPVALLIGLRFGSRSVIAVLLVGAALSLAFRQSSGWHLAYYSTPARAFDLMVGAGLAFFRPVRTSSWILLPAVGALALAVLMTDIGRGTTWGSLFADLAGLGFVAWAATRTAAPSAVRPFVWLGTISYGVYLWNSVILQEMGALGLPSGPLRGTLLVVLTLLVAAASYRWIETPFLKMKSRTRTAEPARDAAPEAAPARVGSAGL